MRHAAKKHEIKPRKKEGECERGRKNERKKYKKNKRREKII